MTRSRYEAGEVIVQENDCGETAYLIEQGQVEVSKELDGHTVHLAYLGTGAIFGEMSMIDEKPRSATVTAVTETVVSALRRDDFFHSFQTDPKVALALLQVLFERLREAHTMILQRPKSCPAARAGPEGTVGRRPASGTAHSDAGRGHAASCRRSPGRTFSDHTLPLSSWQTESRSAGL